jgi:hypothetical protein
MAYIPDEHKRRLIIVDFIKEEEINKWL